MANRFLPATLVALTLAGCSAPMLADPEPGVTVTARLEMRQTDGRRLMEVVSPWTAADVATATVILFKDNADTPDDLIASKDVLNAELGGTITFSNLRRNTAYKILTEARTTAGERIDNAELVPASCTTLFSVETTSPVVLTSAIALQLRNKGFNGTSSGNALSIIDGGVDDPTGPETITVVP